LWLRERSTDGLALFMPVLDRPDADANPELLAGALTTITFVARHVDTAVARRIGERAVLVARQLDDPTLLAESLGMLCAVCYFTGDQAEGFTFGQESVDLARLLDDDVRLGESLLMYLLCSKLIQPEQTEALMAEALACSRRSGDLFLTTLLHNNAGVYALDAGDMVAARAHLEEAEQAGRAMGAEIHNIPINLGWVLREEGDGEASGSMFGDALRQSRRRGELPGIAYSCLGLACLAGDRGDWHRGAVLHGVAQAFFDRTGESCQEPEEGYRRSSLEHVRAHLSEDEFERLFADGARLNVQEAVTLALDSVRNR
jgi:hypothetical protein